MELPKNIIQIGEPDKTHKVYVEDYVVTYMKQLNASYSGKSKGLALYGTKKEEDGIEYYFVYGAAIITGLEYRETYLSQAEQDEIEQIRKMHFPEYALIAWCRVGEERVDTIFLLVNSRGREIKGYACFYEKNEAMLNYMLLLDKQESPFIKEEEDENSQKSMNRGEWRAETYRNALHNKVEEKKEKKAGGAGVLSVLALAACCVIGFLIISDPQKIEELQTVAKQVAESLREQKLTDEILPDETLVMELPDLAEGEVSRRDEPEEEISEPVDGTAEVQVTEEQPEVIEQQPEMIVESDVTEAIEEVEVVEESPETIEETLQESVSGGDAQETEDVNAEPIYTSYLIRTGDTLIQICMNKYGSLEQLELICDINGITNPDTIKVGQIILLP